MNDGRKKQLKNLEIGDQVKSLDEQGRLIDTSVIMIMDTGHQPAIFIDILTQTNRQIKVSRTHLIGLSNGNFKFAYKLTANDSILIYDSKTKKSKIETITSIRIGLVYGYSAPVTQLGTILVNDILISCYALIESHSLAHFVMSPVRLIYSFNELINEYSLYNEADSYHSLFGHLMRITKQKNGVHWYPELLHYVTSKLNLVKIH